MSGVRRTLARRVLAASAVSLGLAAGAATGAVAQVNVIGPCLEGHRWVSTAAGATPVAAYAACRPERPFVTVTCGGGGLRMRVDYPFVGIQPGTRSMQALEVDGTAFLLTVDTGMSDQPGMSFAEFWLDARVQTALAAGNRARFRIGQSHPEMHLAGSHDTLGVLSRHC